MKQLILKTALLTLLGTGLFSHLQAQQEADENSPYLEGTHLVSFGIGYPSITRQFSRVSDVLIDDGATSSSVGPFHLKYGYCFADGWYVGLNTNIDIVKVPFYSNYNTGLAQRDNSITCQAIAFNARINKAWIQKGIFCLFTGVGLGLKVRNYIVKDKNAVTNLDQLQAIEAQQKIFNSLFPIGMETTSGVIVRAAPNFCLSLEAGLAQSMFQIGAVYRVETQRR